MRAGRPRSRGVSFLRSIRRVTSPKADKHPLGGSRWPTCPLQLGRSIEKGHSFNIDAQDAQDRQYGRLLHKRLTPAIIECGFADVQDCKPAVCRKNPVYPVHPC